MKKSKLKAKPISGAKLLEPLDKDSRASAEFVACRLLHRMDINVEISSMTINSQLYQINEPKNDFRCRLKQIIQRRKIERIVELFATIWRIFGAKTDAVAF